MGAIQLLLVVVGAIVVTAVAQRRGFQPALLVVVLASAVSFIPGLPRFSLDPELILSVVLPPLLYSAALNFSFASFTRNLRPILLLGVSLVVVSTLVTGVVATWALPGIVPALVLGAVVSPPDAVAALAVGRELGLPRRLMAILTGESLVNDAAALTIFTLTVAAATNAPTLFGNPVELFLYGALVGILVGLVLGFVVHWVRTRLQESALETALGLLVPFAAYLLAEELHASGVLSVVAAGFVLGSKNSTAGFATRLQAREVWKSLDTLLEAFVFAYMGLQCRFVFTDLRFDWLFALQALTVLLVVLLIRPAWVFLTYGRKWTLAKLGLRTRGLLPWKYQVVISWTGMRGVVTLAAAAGVPPEVPGRDVIQGLAFVVAVGTLLIQGPTLPWLIRRLDISNEDERTADTEAMRQARTLAATTAKDTVKAFYASPPPGVNQQLLDNLRRHYLAAAEARRSADSEMDEVAPQLRQISRSLRRTILAAQREALTDAVQRGEIDDETVRRELERLDYEEAAARTT
ncbi:cation:proton antiporter [Kibdelosporangium lantanae]